MRPLPSAPDDLDGDDEGATLTERTSVLFVCVHNAGRSQMAAAFLRELAGDTVEVRSAGTAPAAAVNPVVVAVMHEAGIDISAQVPKLLSDDAVRASDIVITMGCGDDCPYLPGRSYLDWELEDPAGQDLAAVRRIREDIRLRVEQLLPSLRGHRRRQ